MHLPSRLAGSSLHDADIQHLDHSDSCFRCFISFRPGRDLNLFRNTAGLRSEIFSGEHPGLNPDRSARTSVQPRLGAPELPWERTAGPTCAATLAPANRQQESGCCGMPSLSQFTSRIELKNWRSEMGQLLNRALYHPWIAHPAIYLTELMSSVDWSIGAAMIVLVGTCSALLMRTCRR